MIKADDLNRDSYKPYTEQKFITAFTDASFCPQTKAYGIAYYIRFPCGKIETKSSGGFNMKNISDAERKALVTVIDYLAEKDLQDIIIVLQSDSLGVLNSKSITDKVSTLSAKYVKLKHVRSHTRHNTKRTYCNSIVDKLAKKEMKKYRGKLGN